MTLLIAWSLRASLVLAAGLLLGGGLTRYSAALRHRVLAAALLMAVLVVPLSVVLPGWTITLPVRLIDPGAGEAAVLPGEAVTSTPRHAPGTPHPGAPGRTPSRPAAPRTAPAILIIWLLGVAVAGGRLGAALRRIRRVAARAAPVEDERWLRILGEMAGSYGLSRPVAIARTDSESLLATWGGLRPQILLPRRSRDWTLDRVRVVLSHELAHIRRHDWLVQMGAEALRTILWFNPLAWMVCTRLRRESEQADGHGSVRPGALAAG
jgi:beta-lactamase regulating signal transducer with metallopeptidase domain